ncbi:cilia- and flagella- associated protein 210 [Halyomorpha halys]|uniref:cilia- and flagella- associated protein 210 n=1 Tax=Halyomorpha halys TaxID=286706 RepID=UPI0006D50841|nr:trichohyalin-like [Halyomorpha halys]XP_014275209.1 trichohyalin-like [Halyomorpha halys]
MNVTFLGQNGQKITRLMFSDGQWHQLYDQMTQKQTEKEENERKNMELLRRKQLSMEMAKTWDNTYVNIRKIRYEKRKERLKKEKEYKDKVFRQLQDENEVLKNKIRDKAKDIAFYDQDSTKTFHSAFRISEVQAERQAQLEFNEKLKKIERAIETKYAQSIMDDAKRFKEEQDEEKRQLLELKKKLGAQARISYAEAEKAKRAEKEKIEKEDKEDMALMKRQLEQVIQNENNEILRKKEMIRISLIENRQLAEKNKNLMKQEDEEESKAIEIISNGKMRIAKIRKEKEDQMMENKRNRYQALSTNITQEGQAKLEKEEESYKRAVAKLEKRENDAIEKSKQYQEMLRNERIQTHIDDMKREEERLAKERELLKWEILRRFKREEINNQFSDKSKEDKRKKASYYRNIFKEQIENDIDKKVKEKEIELAAAKKAQENWDMSDKQFLEYAYKVREESKNKGRPLYPLDAAIYEFKKKNQLLKNVRNFIYDATISRPEGIKDYKYELAPIEDGSNQPRPKLESSQNNISVKEGCGCSQNCFNVLESEECGCPKKANGL